MARERSEIEIARDQGVGTGMVIAAAIIVRCWGDTVQAQEILGAAGVRSMDDLRNWGVDAYDVWPLRGVLRRLWNRPQPMPGLQALEAA